MPSVGESKTYFRRDTEVPEVPLELSRRIVMYLVMMFSKRSCSLLKEEVLLLPLSLLVLLCCVLTFFLQLKCLFEWILPGGPLSFMMKCCVKYYPHHLGREEHQIQSRWVWWSGYCAVYNAPLQGGLEPQLAYFLKRLTDMVKMHTLHCLIQSVEWDWRWYFLLSLAYFQKMSLNRMLIIRLSN